MQPGGTGRVHIDPRPLQGARGPQDVLLRLGQEPWQVDSDQSGGPERGSQRAGLHAGAARAPAGLAALHPGWITAFGQRGETQPVDRLGETGRVVTARGGRLVELALGDDIETVALVRAAARRLSAARGGHGVVVAVERGDTDEVPAFLPVRCPAPLAEFDARLVLRLVPGTGRYGHRESGRASQRCPHVTTALLTRIVAGLGADLDLEALQARDTPLITVHGEGDRE